MSVVSKVRYTCTPCPLGYCRLYCTPFTVPYLLVPPALWEVYDSRTWYNPCIMLPGIACGIAVAATNVHATTRHLATIWHFRNFNPRQAPGNSYYSKGQSQPNPQNNHNKPPPLPPPPLQQAATITTTATIITDHSHSRTTATTTANNPTVTTTATATATTQPQPQPPPPPPPISTKRQNLLTTSNFPYFQPRLYLFMYRFLAFSEPDTCSKSPSAPTGPRPSLVALRHSARLACPNPCPCPSAAAPPSAWCQGVVAA